MNSSAQSKKKKLLSIQEMAIFSMLGAMMFCSKLVMEVLPNIHLCGMLIIVYTVVFRKKALIPIYVFVALQILYSAFTGTILWSLPYLYVWTVLWALTMLVPKNIPTKIAAFVYPAICFLHGILFGLLYAPAQSLLFHLNFEQTVAWIIAGLGFDLLHGIGNLFCGLLVLPLSSILRKLSLRASII
jgi:energy-coupling factor transport system substrate-specific component